MQYHKIKVLTGSLNAADLAKSVSHITQVHYVGSQNEIVEVYVAGIFRFKAGRDNYIRIQTVPRARTLKDGENFGLRFCSYPYPIVVRKGISNTNCLEGFEPVTSS